MPRPRDGDFSRKSQIPVHFTPPLTGFPWNWVSAQLVKKLGWGYQTVKKFSVEPF